MEPLVELTAAHRSGTLADRYSDVPALLSGLSDADLTRAGQILSTVDRRAVRERHPAVPELRVAVTGHGTLSGIVAPLTAELARHGLLPDIRVGDYGTYVSDLSSPLSALHDGDPKLVLCVLTHHAVFEQVPVPWRVEDAVAALTSQVGLLRGLVARYDGSATLVLNTLPLPQSVLARLVDHRSRARLGAAWREANAELLRLSVEHTGVVVLDLDALLAGGAALSEPRMSGYAKAHLTPELLGAYARQVGHLARAVSGRGKKVLAVDLDETVWGGVIGEVGQEGIEVADTYRGEAFAAFQGVVKQLASQGVLLAAVSKNDLAPVLDALRTHPRMTLREEDFVRVVADWRVKHEHLSQLAADLNLGVDSIVFVDDNPFECGLVRHALPGVAVVQVDAEPALHVEKLLRDGWFDAVEATDEDRARPARYRDELVRTDFLQSFDSLEDYLAELGVRVRFEPATAAEAARVSQMTLRTNQFNLTTVRLQQADVLRLLDDRDAEVLVIESGDRFGDNGLVGAVFLRREGDAVRIDNFVLSCRVFARGIEQTCLAEVLRRAAATGATHVLASHRPTAKNHGVGEFYPRNGFTPVGEDGGVREFRHDLADIPTGHRHVRLTAAATPEGSTA
ncbi:HAD-IIIC family phosphatase [Umezawaea tangerina]|uniref:D-glyceryl-ACP synthase n=1 Tax=Umezawaea tangerina TaxID=84725 RepID=A0A2T0SNB9_9PSEU|nr:HAD-IIIC family phosphatase [Umezawaea tangerina]PRY34873.1 D-glyceryl-ACP synthase [Umezawaea tangerina]